MSTSSRFAVQRHLRWIALCAFALTAGKPENASAATVYAFGDSLLDDGTVYRTTGSRADAATGVGFSGTNFSNGVTAFDYLGRLTGATVEASNDHAIAGVFSGLNSSSIGDYPGTLAQVEAFVAAGGTFSSRDLIILDGGTNEVGTVGDPSYGLPDGLTSPTTAASVAAYVGSNFTAILTTLEGVGAKDVFLYNVPSTSAAGTAINAELLTVAASLSGHGLNVHYFDLLLLYEKVASNATVYGFVSGASCQASAACVADTAIENSYFTVDGLHPTTAGHSLIASYLASQYEAPQAVLPQANLAQASAIMFSQTLIERLDAPAETSRGPAVPAAVTSFLPNALVPTALGPVTSFVSASVAGGSGAAPRSASGPTFASFGYTLAGLTAGLEVQPTASIRLGTAFSYLGTSTAKAYASTSTTLNAFQSSVYGAWAGSHVFVDEVVTYGLDVFETSRAGVVSRLQAIPLGATVSTQTKVGYLADFGALRIGPIVDLAYTHAMVAPYSEWGDSLLTLNVKRQTLDDLTGAAGVQFRSGGLIWPWLSASLDLTADDDILGNGRTLLTSQTYAPSVLIRTTTTSSDDPYGRVRGGLHADFAPGFSGELSGFGTFEKASGNLYGLDARLVYRF